MRDKKHPFTPLSHAELAAELAAAAAERLLTRPQLCERWGGCSEKALVRAEPRLGLEPIRILRGVRYALSNILDIERNGRAKLPKRFTGLRPDQKAELLRREREEDDLPPRSLSTIGAAHITQNPGEQPTQQLLTPHALY